MNKLFIIFTILLLSSLSLANEYDPLQARAEEYLKQAFNLYNSAEFEKGICLYKKALDLKPVLGISPTKINTPSQWSSEYL